MKAWLNRIEKFDWLFTTYTVKLHKIFTIMHALRFEKKNRDAIGRDHHVVWMKWHGHLKTGENDSKKQIPENSKHWVVVDKFLQDGIQRQKRKMVPRSHVDQFQNELNNVHKLYEKNVQQQTTM